MDTIFPTLTAPHCGCTTGALCPGHEGAEAGAQHAQRVREHGAEPDPAARAPKLARFLGYPAGTDEHAAYVAGYLLGAARART